MKQHILIISIFCLLAGAFSAFAYVTESNNYRIESESVNVAGARQISNNYIMEETVGEIATGISTTTSYKLKAGYQQMQEVYLAISSPDDVTMSPSIGGVTGGTSNGQASWTVTTDSASGYILSIKSSTSPSLKTGVYSFADYTPVSAGTPDYTWAIDVADSEFGFTPEGTDIVQKFKDNGSSFCNTGSSMTADACWHNFSTSDENIASTYSPNHPSGTATTVKFRAQSGTSHIQADGTYTATVTVTALAN